MELNKSKIVETGLRPVSTGADGGREWKLDKSKNVETGLRPVSTGTMGMMEGKWN